MKIKVRIEITDDTPLGVPSGKTKWLAWVADSGGRPFSGCPLGRSTNGESGAILDLIRPGYSLPYEYPRQTLADVEVTSRKDNRAGRTCDKCREKAFGLNPVDSEDFVTLATDKVARWVCGTCVRGVR